MESFRALKFSNQESFRALKFSFRVLDFRVRKYSNLESCRALKLSDLKSFRVRKSSIRVLRFVLHNSTADKGKNAVQHTNNKI